MTTPGDALREIGSVRQEDAGRRRRWFQSPDLELFVWQEADGAPVAMHLCYDRHRQERALVWDARTGFAHHVVDTGETTPQRDRTPLLRSGGTMPYFEVYARFLAASMPLDRVVRTFVLARLHEWRQIHFGRPRQPRRTRRRIDSAKAAE